MSLDMKAIVKVMNGDLLDCHCAIFVLICAEIA